MVINPLKLKYRKYVGQKTAELREYYGPTISSTFILSQIMDYQQFCEQESRKEREHSRWNK